MAPRGYGPTPKLALMNEPGSRQSNRVGQTLVPVMLIGSLVMVTNSLMGERGTAGGDHTSRQDAFPRRRDH